MDRNDRLCYDFSGVDISRLRYFGDSGSKNDGFFFDGDNERPVGVYSLDGVFYGDRGVFAEFDVIMDTFVKNQAEMIDGLLNVAFIRGMSRDGEKDVLNTLKGILKRQKAALE